ncbi:cysteine-rich secretory protein 3-like [Tubulanus polymorphus]|uniref:cysteine-rich secretory protein 3-like n=1 Tax=Tubulanus polymorphus TaxID=672921 RepID=UPI003DA2ED9F
MGPDHSEFKRDRRQMNMLTDAIVVTVLLLLPAVTMAQTLHRGFTTQEKQRLLDLHNLLRAKVATGRQAGQPQAANMMAMEWDDRLVRSSQNWATQCQGWHNDNRDRMFKPYPHVGQNYAGNYGIVKSMKVWFEEVKYFHYNTGYCSKSPCGHYTQLIWWNSALVGCGYDDCKGRRDMTTLYCDYAPGGNVMVVGKSQQEKPYIEGPPCSKCPDGYGLCMAGALCASAKACQSSKTGCECGIKSCRNGGVLDSVNCKCKCSEKWQGNRCEIPCEDKITYCDQYTHQCSWNANMWLWMGQSCQKTCHKCGPVKDDNTSNRDGIKTNVIKYSGSGTGQSTDTDTTEDNKPTTGGTENCKNTYSNSRKCDDWAKTGECQKNPVWMKTNCAKSCKSCKTDSDKSNGCTDIHNSSACSAWAADGECDANPIWMKKNCASACNSC